MLKNIRRTYILAVAVVGLLVVALYSTYAMFTANVDLADVSITPNVTLDAKLLEYEQLTIPKNEYKIIELNVANDYDSELYYEAWYEMINPSIKSEDIIIAKYSESQDETSGTIGQNITKKIKVIIYNKKEEDITLNIGIGSNVDQNLNLGDNRHLIENTYTVVKAKITPGNAGTLNTKEQVIKQNETAIFNVIPTDGYEIDKVSCDNNKTATVIDNTVTVSNVVNAMTCTITMKKKTYQVTAKVLPEESATIKEPSSQQIEYGKSATFTITPNDSYKYVSAEGCTYDEDTKIATVSNVTENVTCTVTFKKPTGADVLLDKCQTGGWDAGAEGLYEDEFGNCRYVGAEPNNWIKFNDDMYRIIGIFDESTHGIEDQKLIKLIYPDTFMTVPYGAYNTDEKSGIYSNYSNDWTGSQHSSPSTSYLILNEYFYNATDTSEKYGSCENWTYYYNKNDYKTGQCDTIKKYGIKNEYRDYVEKNATWYLYGPERDDMTKEDMYKCERGKNEECSFPYEASTKTSIGLMYPSDYLYANGYYSNADLVKDDRYLFAARNWLYEGSEYILSPKGIKIYYNNGSVYYIYDRGISSNSSYYARIVRPTFYLKSDVKITKGTGTYNDPYEISM